MRENGKAKGSQGQKQVTVRTLEQDLRKMEIGGLWILNASQGIRVRRVSVEWFRVGTAPEINIGLAALDLYAKLTGRRWEHEVGR